MSVHLSTADGHSGLGIHPGLATPCNHPSSTSAAVANPQPLASSADKRPGHSSPEKLDWGSIDDEDGAYAAKPAMLDAGTPASAWPAQRASSPEPRQVTQVTLKTPLSPLHTLEPAAPPPKTVAKLKSVLVVPERLNEAEECSGLNAGARQQGCDPSLKWQMVKSKRQARQAGPSSLAGPSKQRGKRAMPPSIDPPSPDYKSWFQGRCFRCLSKDHRVARCRDPPRCLNCLGSGHFTRRCRAPPNPLRPSLAVPNQPKKDIRARLTFPPGSIHSRLTFPELAYAAAAATPPADLMAQGIRAVAGLPSERPAQGRATVVAGGAMTSELTKLRRKAVVLTTLDLASWVCAATVTFELHRQFRLPLWNITVSPHKPENYPEQRGTAVRAGSLFVGSTLFQIHPWRLDSYTRPSDWFFNVKICIERLPLHAWSADGVKQVLGDVVVFDHMEDSSFHQDNTEFFSFHAWMRNPDLLPRSKIVTFFPERAGQSSTSDGPPPTSAASVAPSGSDITLIIHLAHFYDWTPQFEDSSSSEMSGIPTDSSVATESLHWTLFLRSFHN
jgi:hypothetical protein